MKSLQELAWRVYLRDKHENIFREVVPVFKNGKLFQEVKMKRRYPGSRLITMITAIEKYEESKENALIRTWPWNEEIQNADVIEEEFIENTGNLYQAYAEKHKHFIKRLKTSI